MVVPGGPVLESPTYKNEKAAECWEVGFVVAVELVDVDGTALMIMLAWALRV